MTFLLGDRNSYDMGVKLRARGLINLPDSTSQKFLLLGQVSKTDPKYGDNRAVIVFLDFSKTRGRKCGDSDYEKWYARPHNSECLMGHRVCAFLILYLDIIVGRKGYTLICLFVLQQWYKRRKPDANCYVGEKYNDPVTHEDNCECTAADYEWYVDLLRPSFCFCRFR